MRSSIRNVSLLTLTSSLAISSLRIYIPTICINTAVRSKLTLLSSRKASSSTTGTNNNNNFKSRQNSKSFTTVSSPEENMLLVSKAVELRSSDIITGLSINGWAVCDNFLGPEVCKVYRDEALGFTTRREMTLSKSTRWDADKQSVVTYDKHNVYATQLVGGEMYYKSPRLHEYVVSLIKSLVPAVSSAFPEACLSTTMASNKLAVCTGSGSYYDKHYDNSGHEDLRKLTVLYYMNPLWKPELGGCFRIHMRERNEPGMTTPIPIINGFQGVMMKDDICYDVEPIADRLLVFWSDKLVHSVQPSYAPEGVAEYRWALTVWITATNPEAIVHNDTEVLQHFSELQRGAQG